MQDSLQTVINAAPELPLEELVERIRSMANERRVQPSLSPTFVGPGGPSESEALTAYHRELARALGWISQNLQGIQHGQAVLDARIAEEAADRKRDDRRRREELDGLRRRAQDAERAVEALEARVVSLDQRLTRAFDELSVRIEIELAMAEGRLRLLADHRVTEGEA